jgi:hypothetical protein
MKLLLDTHAILCFFNGDNQFSGNITGFLNLIERLLQQPFRKEMSMITNKSIRLYSLDYIWWNHSKMIVDCLNCNFILIILMNNSFQSK